MDDEIIEAFHENPFHYHEEKVEDNCHDIQQNFQQNIVPFLIVNNETDQDLSILSHIPSPEIDEHVQQNCQILSDQDLSSDHAYSEILFQEASYQNQSVEIVYMETLSSEPSHDIEFQENNELVYDSCISEAQEDNEEEIVFLDSLESQDQIFVESYEGSICVAPITCDVAAFEDLQEHTSLVPDLNDREEQFSAILCEGDQLHQLEQPVENEGYLLLSLGQEEVTFHVFQDPLASLLQSSVKVDFVVFMDYGFKFQLEFELLVVKFSFYLKKMKANSSY
jgi:hypothetical protein